MNITMEKIQEVEILLVEDNPADIEMITRTLKKCGLSNRLLVIRDGEEALDYLFSRGKYAGRNTAEVPKVILLDLRLPKVDGIEVLRQVRADERTMSIPVVILTSSKEAQDLRDAYSLGVNSFVTKPFDLELFLKAVTELGMYWGILNKPPL